MATVDTVLNKAEAKSETQHNEAGQKTTDRPGEVSAWISRLGTIAVIGLLTLFFGMTVIVGASGVSKEFLVVKHDILLGLAVLIPIILMVAASVSRLRAVADVEDCVRRIKFAALIVCVILMPIAASLNWLAQNYMFETLFFFLQGTELLFQEFVVALMVFNLRSEFKAKRHPRKSGANRPARTTQTAPVNASWAHPGAKIA